MMKVGSQIVDAPDNNKLSLNKDLLQMAVGRRLSINMKN